MINSKAWSWRSLAAVFLAFASDVALAVPPPDETPPTDPPGFTATVISANQINLSWGASTDNKGVTAYYIQRCQPSSCIPRVLLLPSPTSYSSTGLSSGVTYTYYLIAADAAGNESNSVDATATTPDNVAPSSPSSLGANASGAQVILNWPAASDNVAVTGYLIEYCAGAGCSPVSSLTTTGSTSYTASLAEATTYSFRVRAYDLAGNYSNPSPTASATTADLTPPTAPSSLAAPSSNGTQINLTWTGSTDNVAVAYYEVEYCAGSGCANFVGLASLSTTSYTAGGLTPATTYSFRARARDTANLTSGYSNIASRATTDTISPTTPTNLTATPNANGTQVDLSWTASTDNVGVSVYGIERCNDAGCTSVTQIGTSATTGYSATSLTPATTYRFQVRAYDAANNFSSAAGPVVATTIDTIAPTPPTTLSATAASASQIDLNWSGAGDNVAVTLYSIERCQGSGCTSFAEIATTAAPPYTNTTLPDNTPFRYQVRARDAKGNWSTYSPAAQATTKDGTAPNTPTNLVANAASATQINLTWTAPTDNVGVTGYSVERCAGTGCTSFVEVATPTAASYNDMSLSNGATYRYRVRAHDAVPLWSGFAGPVERATTDTQPPTQPTGLTVNVISAQQLNLTWTVSTDNVGVTSYSIERCQGSACTNFVAIGTSATNSYSSTGLAAGTSYRYQVRAQDAALLWSAYSASAGGTTATDAQAPTVPTGVTAVAASSVQINLNWTASTDNVAVTAYVVERCQGASCTTFTQVATPSTNSYNDTGRAPNTTYRYQIKARDAVPNTSAASSIVSATTPPDTQAPMGTAVAVSGTTVVQVSLTLSASDNVGVTGYLLERCTGATCTTFTQIATPSTSTYTDTGRAPNTTYRYQARARDAAGNISAYSAITSATTPADTAVPSQPANLRTTGKTDTTVALAWDASTDNVGVTSYRIERCQGATCTTYTEVGSTTGATTYTSAGMTQLTTYRFRVRARDAANLNSNYSSTLNVTTNDGQAPTAPGPLTVTVNLSQITLSWTASTDNVGVTAYLVERCTTASCTYAQIASVPTLSYIDPTVASGTNYTYRVRARDAQGNLSGYSTANPALSADCD